MKKKSMIIVYVASLIVLLCTLIAVFGIGGLVLGSVVGGNYGCFDYRGLVGYEACGIFFAHLGLVLGALASAVIIRRSYKAIKEL